MEQQKVITGKTEEDLWQQVVSDLKESPDFMQYNVLLEQKGKQVALIIDIDPGGGFESGYATTQVLAPISDNGFTLKVRPQGILQEAGKLFGVQDIVIGIPEIDKKFLIRSNDEAKAKNLFEQPEINEMLLALDGVTLQTTSRQIAEGTEAVFLELLIEDGITEPEKLRAMYAVCVQLRDRIDAWVRS